MHDDHHPHRNVIDSPVHGDIIGKRLPSRQVESKIDISTAAILEGGYSDDLPGLIDTFLTAWTP